MRVRSAEWTEARNQRVNWLSSFGPSARAGILFPSFVCCHIANPVHAARILLIFIMFVHLLRFAGARALSLFLLLYRSLGVHHLPTTPERPKALALLALTLSSSKLAFIACKAPNR